MEAESDGVPAGSSKLQDELLKIEYSRCDPPHHCLQTGCYSVHLLGNSLEIIKHRAVRQAQVVSQTWGKTSKLQWICKQVGGGGVGGLHPSTHSYLEQLRVAGSVIRRTLPCPVHPVSYQAAAKGRREKLPGLSQKAENAEKLVQRQAEEGAAHRYRPSYRKLMCRHVNQMANHMIPRSAD